MEEKIKSKINSHNFGFLLMCIIGLVAFYFIGIYPLYIDANNLKVKISKLQLEVKNQAKLHTMLDVIDQEGAPNSVENPLPDVQTSPLPKNLTDQILPDFKKIATNSTMQVLEVSPQLKKTTNWDKLVITAVLQGDFKNIRSFLYDLLNLTYVSQINKIEFKASGDQLEFKLTYSVNLS